MSWRSSSAQLVAGKWVSSKHAGHGITGAALRAATGAGGAGAGVLYNDWDAGDDAKEFRALLVTAPAAGVLTMNEDGSFSLTGAADGTYSLTYRLFVDGVDLGVAAAAITVGAAVVFAVSAAGLASTLAYGAPSFARYVDFAVAATGLASAVAFGNPSFSALREFSLAPAGLPSAAAYGVASLSFQVPDPGEPVTVDEAKQAARFDGDELDAFISGVISAARAQAEQITGRVYRRRVFSFELSSWPAPGHRFAVHEPDACEISYWGASGWQQLSGSAFEFDGVGSGAEIAPALGSDWPALAAKALGARVRVDFTAGPTDSARVDETVKLYIKAQVAAWLNSPEAMADKDLQASPLIARLLDAERLWC